MTKLSLAGEVDPTRRSIIKAINRLLAGTPQRSTGRLNVTQLAIEAGLKRWHLTHQHPDLKDHFQRLVADDDAKRRTRSQTTVAFEDLKAKHSDLQAHCQALEAQLQTYATALSLLTLENAALSGRDAEAAKLRVLPRQQHLP